MGRSAHRVRAEAERAGEAAERCVVARARRIGAHRNRILDPERPGAPIGPLESFPVALDVEEPEHERLRFAGLFSLRAARGPASASACAPAPARPRRGALVGVVAKEAAEQLRDAPLAARRRDAALADRVIERQRTCSTSNMLGGASQIVSTIRVKCNGK